MPWKECDAVSERREFVALAMVEGANVAALCRRFGISRRTGYKWLRRFKESGLAALADRSRRPWRFRQPTPPVMESKVLAVRDAHPTWGGRKIAARLRHLGEHSVPAPSTITAILHRHDRIDPAESAKRGPWRRFEHAAPNDLWQMDFKGEFKMTNGRWCYPLTVLDDHSRFNLALRACGDQKRPTVQDQLTAVFQRYGLPQAMLMDNGTPWSVSHSIGAYTKLSVWLLRLQIRVIRGRPYHPQTQGKEERFHRTLNTELLQGRPFNDLRHSQTQFDPWREIYNHQRPHEALNMNTPASQYRISPRPMPATLPAIEYGSQDHVRRVNPVGQFHFQGRVFKTSEAFAGQPIGIRPTTTDGVFELYFTSHPIGSVNLHRPQPTA